MNEFNIEKVDLNLLKSLQALLSERHVGRAAKRMHLSQSAMSHTLSRLRNTFNDPLFVRTAKGLEPTARLLALSGDLNSILSDISTLLAPKYFEPSKVNSVFRLQTHSFIISSYLAPFFKRINKVAPNLIFETHAISEYSYQQLDKGAVDLIVAAGHQAPNQMMQRKIVTEDRVCLVDKNHPAISHWSIDNFLKYRHIKNTLLEEKDDPISKALSKCKLPARVIGFYADDMLAQGVFLKDSELIATIPRTLAQIEQEQNGHVILPCPLETDAVTIKAIWHERSQNEPLHQWLRNELAAINFSV
ncbi:LysR family transcriptional regulator [Colwellia sp. RE-S-Sl-9]